MTNVITEITRECEEWLSNHAPRWHLEWSRRLRVTAGRVNYRHKTMYLSVPIVQLNGYDAMRLTMRHEFAHILTPGHYHDSVWRAKCLELGGTGKTYHNYTVPPKKYLAVCLAGHRFYKAQRPRGYYSCSKCTNIKKYDHALRLEWEINPAWESHYVDRTLDLATV